MEILSEHENGLSLVDLSTRVEMNKTTVYRLLTTLIEKEYVEQNEETKHYFLSNKILDLARISMRKGDLRDVVRRHAKTLVDEMNLTVYLAKMDAKQLMVLDVICREELIGSYFPGKQLPLHATAAGRIMLANMPMNECNAEIQSCAFPSYTPYSITNRKALEDSVRYTRLQGYSVEQQDYVNGVSAVAVPLYDHSRNVIATLGACEYAVRFDNRRKSEMILTLLACAERISDELGYHSV